MKFKRSWLRRATFGEVPRNQEGGAISCLPNGGTTINGTKSQDGSADHNNPKVTCIEFFQDHTAGNGKLCDASDLGCFDLEANQKCSIVDCSNLAGGGKRKSYGTYSSHGSSSTSGSDDNNYGSVAVADIIGSFGWFQFLVLLFSGLREAAVGYDAVVMSIILQPESNFYCVDKLLENGYRITDNRTEFFNETAQCYQSINGQMLMDAVGEPIKCRSWIFPHLDKVSLVADWSLVCHRHWMVAFIESAYFMGLVTGNLVWGYYADKVGRRRAYLLAHTVALTAGWLSVVVPHIELFAICRFVSAFGSIGYNIIYSIQVELIGTKHRSFSTTLNHLGWGLGVIFVPMADHLFTNYRYIILLGPFITLLMYPWAFWIPESSRWLMLNEDFSGAKRELIRAAKFNGKPITPALKKKISLLKDKVTNDRLKQQLIHQQQQQQQNQRAETESQITATSATLTDKKQRPYHLLFHNRALIRDTIILAYVSFTGHLFYYMLTINFGYMKNLSTDANFIISGAGEWVSVVIGAILLKFFSRKVCMSLFLFLLGSSFVFQALIDAELATALDTPVFVTVNNGVGTLSALLLIFVALIVNQEVYPTVIRQTGSSIVNTLGESGSTLAPLLIQLGHRLVGIWKMDIVYAIVCAVGMVGINFITKTDDIELLDT